MIQTLVAGMEAFLDRHQDKGWQTLDDFRGQRRDRIVAHSDIKRLDTKGYFGGHDVPEGYAQPAPLATDRPG